MVKKAAEYPHNLSDITSIIPLLFILLSAAYRRDGLRFFSHAGNNSVNNIVNLLAGSHSVSDHPINTNMIVQPLDNYLQPQPSAAPTLTLTWQLVAISQSSQMLSTAQPVSTYCLPVAISALPECPEPDASITPENWPEPPALPESPTLPQSDMFATPFAQRRPPAAILPMQPEVPLLSDYAKSLKALIKADRSGQLSQHPDESLDKWATRLKEYFPEMTARDASAVTRASIWGLERRKAFKFKPPSPLACKILNEVRQSPPDPYKSTLQLAEELRKRYPQLTKDEVVFITGANPVSLQNLPAFKKAPLSRDGQKAQELWQQSASRFPDKESPVDRARDWQRLAAENSLKLTRVDLMQLAEISAPLLCKHPELMNPPLSSNGEFVKQQIAERNPRFMPPHAQTSGERAASLLELVPELGTIDLVMLTGVKYNTAALLRALQKKPLTAAGKMLQQRLASRYWNPYQPVAGENALDWGIRVSNMDYRLTADDIAKLNFCSVYSLRKRLRRRSPLSAPALRVMAKLNSTRPGELACRLGEEWDLWFERLNKKEPQLTEQELFLITGFTPEIQLNYPANIVQPSAEAVATLAATPTLVELLTTTTPAAASETSWAHAQSVSLAMQDQILQARGLARVVNNGDTSTPYRNCLLISLLQHATGDYTQSPSLCQLANNYRQLLVEQGWLDHANGFGPDGYMAFGQQGETVQGAAAALLEMINSNLVKGGLPPLRVVNLSFAAGMEFEEILGSQAADARLVHIVNTGQHFEALIAAPAASQA